MLGWLLWHQDQAAEQRRCGGYHPRFFCCWASRGPCDQDAHTQPKFIANTQGVARDEIRCPANETAHCVAIAANFSADRLVAARRVCRSRIKRYRRARLIAWPVSAVGVWPRCVSLANATAKTVAVPMTAPPRPRPSWIWMLRCGRPALTPAWPPGI